MTGPVIIAEIRKSGRERARVCLDTFHGHNLIDLRITTQLNAETGDWLPTKKGVSLNVALLPDLVAAFTAAEAKARELGLIGGDAHG